MMPVSYAGGRDVSHAHAFVQLLMDAARGTTNHHLVHEMTQEEDVHTAAIDAFEESPAAKTARMTKLPSGVPVLGVPTPPIEPIAAISLALILTSVFFPGGRALFGGLTHRLFGIARAPSSPPPRFEAVFA